MNWSPWAKRVLIIAALAGLLLVLVTGLALANDPTGASTVSAQAGLSAEVHVTHSVSVVVSGNVTFTPDDHGVNVGAGGTASILVHGN